jgi:thiamine-monophosphate kinase
MARKTSSRASGSGEESLLHTIQHVQLPMLNRKVAVRVGIGDDAAVWQPRSGYQTILTCDWFLEDTHFLVDRHPPESVGWKCLARALSDIAAMGADPRCFLLSLALPKEREGKWLKRFLKGLRSASRSLKCPIAGGDTTRRGQILINLTAIGECRRGRAVLRSAARPGDVLFVTGRLGEAEYGLRLLKSGAEPSDPRVQKHLYPKPRLAVGRWLAERKLATAMMDLSDGLSTDLPRLCAASNLGALIEQHRIPCVSISRTPGAPDRKRFDPIELATNGGDDYELLFAVSKNRAERLPRVIAGVTVARIGEITANKKIVIVNSNRKAKILLNRGWDPFR